MVKSLYEYLPRYFKQMKDLKIILDIGTEELEKLEANIKQVKDNFYIPTADEKTIAEYEKILNITVEPTETLETRRQMVLAMYNNYVPYTNKTLKDKLNSLLTPDGYSLSIDYPNYKITIMIYQLEGITPSIIRVIEKMLVTMIPAHMVFDVVLGTEIETESKENYGLKVIQANIYDVEFR